MSSGEEQLTDNKQNNFDKDSPIAEKTIHLTIDNVSSLTRKESPTEEIATLPWSLDADIDESNDKSLSVYVYCNWESISTLWKCRAKITIVLINRIDSSLNFHENFTHLFQFNESNRGYTKFRKFQDVIAPEKGFIHDDQINVEARVCVLSVEGVRPLLPLNFSESNGITETSIKINERHFYISKELLALQSLFFKTMFYGSFEESKQSTIELKDVDEDEFQSLLEVVCPPFAPITDKNVSCLLKLADRFLIDYVIVKCENYLLKTKKFTIVKKLLYAEKYKLSKLQDECVEELNQIQDFKDIENMDGYRDLSYTTKAALFVKLMKII